MNSIKLWISKFLIIFIISPCFAGEKEELQCKSELLNEKILRMQAQAQINLDALQFLQIEIDKTQSELKNVKQKLQEFDSKKNEKVDN